MAKAAKFHLDASVVGGAGTRGECGGCRIRSNNGTSYSQAEMDENYGPINLGQLKAVAKPFC